MKIISFNTNGLRARLHQLQEVIERHAPDLIGLQESKVSDQDFPIEAITNLGYRAYYHGQKAHYGVAFLAKEEPLTIYRGYPGDPEDAQRRLIIGAFALADGRTLNVINGYFPQGESRNHEVKFPAKRRFYQDLINYLNDNFSPSDRVVIMGDFNISPQDSDIGIGVKNAKRWLKTGKCSFLPEEREWYQQLLGWGLKDTYRLHYPDTADCFSWFSYRSRGFENEPKRGLRIDHILATQSVAACCVQVGIDYQIRGMKKPSDHCPIWADFHFPNTKKVLE